jgi:hypothetical protein
LFRFDHNLSAITVQIYAFIFVLKCKSIKKFHFLVQKNVVMYFLAFFVLRRMCIFAANLKGHEFIGADTRERRRQTVS